MTTDELMDAQIKAMGEEIARLKDDLARAEERTAHKARILEQANDALMAEVDETDRLRDDLAQATREIERLRGQVRELIEQRNTLQDMAREAARFGDLGGGR